MGFWLELGGSGVGSADQTSMWRQTISMSLARRVTAHAYHRFGGKIRDVHEVSTGRIDHDRNVVHLCVKRQPLSSSCYERRGPDRGTVIGDGERTRVEFSGFSNRSK